MSELRCIDSNNGEVGVWIVACHLGRIFASIRQGYNHRTGVVNDVAVGQDESIGRDHEPGAVSAEFARSAP